MVAVLMGWLKHGGQISRGVKMLRLVKMLPGAAVQIWYIQHMVQIKKGAAFPQSLVVVQIEELLLL